MNSRLKKLAEKINWEVTEDSIFGSYDGYLLTLMEGKGFTACFVSCAGASDEQLNELTFELAAKDKYFHLYNYEIAENFLCVRLKETILRRNVNQLELFIAQFVLLLLDAAIPKHNCIFCGKDAVDSGLYLDLCCYIHPACLEEDKRNEENENMVSSGALNKPAQEIIDQLTQSMEGYREQFINDLERLLKIPSVSVEMPGENPFGPDTVKALAEFFEIGKALGFKCVNLDNYAGYLEWGEGEKMIAILCHLDVVPAGEGWTEDPFSPRIEGDKMIARGVADDKGPLISSLYAIKSLMDEGFKPNCRIRLIAGLNEEKGSACMAHYCEVEEIPVMGFTADANFPVIYAEKGIMQLEFSYENEMETSSLQEIKGGSAANVVPAACHYKFKDEAYVVQGTAAHASLPHLGVNSISKAILEIKGKLDDLKENHSFIDFYVEHIAMENNGAALGIDCSDESGALTFNVAIIDFTPQKATFIVDIRYPIHADIEALLKVMQNNGKKYNVKVKALMNLKPLDFPKDSKLVQGLMKVYNAATKTETEAIAIGGGTYARAVPNIVAFGPSFPGDPDQCHQVGEYASINRLLAAGKIYADAIKEISKIVND